MATHRILLSQVLVGSRALAPDRVQFVYYSYYYYHFFFHLLILRMIIVIHTVNLFTLALFMTVLCDCYYIVNIFIAHLHYSPKLDGWKKR